MSSRMVGRVLPAMFIAFLAITVPAVAQSTDVLLDMVASDGQVERGQRFYYHVAITHPQPNGSTMENVQLQMLVPEHVTIDRNNLAGLIGRPETLHCNPFRCDGGSLLTLSLPELHPGKTRILQLPAAVSEDLPAAQMPLSIQAEISAVHDAAPSTVTAQADVSAVFSVTSRVSVQSTQPTAMPAGAQAYTLYFGHMGELPLTGARLRMELPEGVSVIDAQGGRVDGQSVRWDINRLNAGHASTRQILVDGIQGPGQHLKATARLETSDGRAVASSGVVVAAPSRHPLDVRLSIDEDPIQRQDRFTYQLAVTNTQGASGATLEDIRAHLRVPRHVQLNRFNITGADRSQCRYSCRAGDLLELHINTLQPGETRVITMVAQVEQDAPFGSVAPAPLMVHTEPAVHTSRVTAEMGHLVQSRDFTIQVNARPVISGEASSHVIQVTYGNRGEAPADNLQVILRLPENMEIADADGADRQGNILTWSIDSLQAGKTGRRQVVIDDTWLQRMEVEPALVEARLAEPDSHPGDFLARANGLVVTDSDSPLVVALSVSQDPAPLEAPYHYHVTVVNTNSLGGAPLEDVTLHARVPEQVAINRSRIIGEKGVSWSTGTAGTVFPVNLGTLAPGEVREIQVPAEAIRDAHSGSTNSFWVSAEHAGSRPQLAHGSIAAGLEQKPSLSLALSGKPLPVEPNQDVDLYLVLGNTRTQDDLRDVQVTLQLPPGVQVRDAAGAEQEDGHLVWNISRLPAGAGRQYPVVLREEGQSQSRILKAHARVDFDEAGASRVAHAHGAGAIKAAGSIPLSLSAWSEKATAEPGDRLDLRLLVSNDQVEGGSALESIQVNMQVPQGLRIDRSSITGVSNVSCSSRCDAGNLLRLDIGTLQPQQSRLIRIPGVVPDDTSKGLAVQARFQASAQLPSGRSVQPIVDAATLLVGSDAEAPPEEFTLVARVEGEPHGRIVSEPAGIDCGSACSADYLEGSFVTLTAQPANDAVFAGWGGACFGSAPTCRLEMDQDLTAVASFVRRDDTTPEPPEQPLPGVPERAEVPWQVSEIYMATMGYAPDAEGVDYWSHRVDTDPNWTPLSVAMAFFDQPLVQAQYPDDQPAELFIDAMYRNIFGRPADEPGMNYWLDELGSGRVQRNQMIITLLNGGWDNPEAQQDMARFGNRIRVSLAFVEHQRERGIQYGQLPDNGQQLLRQIGRDVLDGVTADPDTVDAARNQIPDLLAEF
ncbi:DUF4214 domain-containing protein [Ectothiorhodospira variabilis]|uniref:DUF4214 domain-containing protein n=2 Tax=Ectothiorhodospira variabilis TaxID=505694 RepID=UPI001EFB0646|nr:DUF4214 domain-containing protein [Ectothiorhodospira variabilis]MCG5495694.1 DUF4214 domain-containing protein [Ectothiorhodospira variabilis]MCG5504590.1 DUF4214 domain-containing protein [Ectothiorhodospira variabilis]MCG5507702.1 DUF4214 domain-containing protein [Ectothiorhodospira variabilis]